MNWHEFYIGMCLHISQKSKDRSTKLGAVIVGANEEVLAIGFNGFPRGVDDEEERFHERPMKYRITEHAERNAIYNAARRGIMLEGATMYLPFEPTPCTDCTRGVIQSGIKRIIGTDVKFTGKGIQWDEDLMLANEMLKQAEIEQIVYDTAGTELDIRKLYGVEEG
jgi:dCMP deaminase